MQKPKVWIVQGTHWYCPGNVMTAYKSALGANIAAAMLVIDLRRDVGMSKNVTAKNWDARLQAARRRRAKEIGCDVDSLDESDADVWITELDLN